MYHYLLSIQSSTDAARAMLVSCQHLHHAPVSSSRSQRLCCPLHPGRQSQLTTAVRWAAFAPFASVRTAASISSSPAQAPWQRAGRFVTAAESPQSTSSSGKSSGSEPSLAADAISAGLQAYQGGDHEGALDMFQQALSLPGTGFKRYR